MNINELKAEAKRLGFSLSKKINYEKLLPCPCGNRHWLRQEITVRDKYYHCAKCGYKSKPAKYKYQAITNWNNAVRDIDGYNKHQDERIKKLLEEHK